MTGSAEDAAAAVAPLLAIMRRLRDADGGCPWDRAQTFATIAPYTIEEAYEVADAIERGDLDGLKDELGDLLFQVVFHACMAEEAGAFGFAEVAAAICAKMERRHPHVFGAADERGAVASAAEQTAAWERHKARERAAQRDTTGGTGALGGVPSALPALTRAVKLQRRAARVGFDWPAVAPVLAKVDEELDELRREVEAGGTAERIAEELGDLLFACANLARHLDVDPEAALRRGNAKFERRFAWIEARLAEQGRTADAVGLDTLEALWQEAKRAERG